LDIKLTQGSYSAEGLQRKIYTAEKQVQNVLREISLIKESLNSLEKKIETAQLSCYFKEIYGNLEETSKLKKEEDQLAKLLERRREKAERRAKREEERKRKERERNQLLSATIHRAHPPKWSN